LAALLALAAAPGRAAELSHDSAEIGAARLAVTRAPGALECPGAAELRSGLEPLGIDATNVEPIEIDVEIRLLAGGFEAYVSVPGAQGGVRDLRAEGPGCARLAADLTAALALLLDRRHQSPPPEKASEPAPVPSPPVEHPVEPVRVPPARRSKEREPQRSAWHGQTALGGGMAVGLVGPPATFLALGLELGPPGGWLGVRAFSTFDAANELGSGSIAVRLTGGSIEGCLPVLGSAASMEAHLCLTGALGALRGVASGYASTEPAAYRPWYALGAATRLAGPLSGALTWAVTGDLLAPLHHESFSIGPLGKAFETPLLGALLGIELRLRVW
jgi:hypothetical protein